MKRIVCAHATDGGRCLMPRIATATSAQDEEASSSRVDDLIQRGRSQGHLSLSDLRTAFEQAGLQPAEARSILRELSEAGVRLADEESDVKAPRGKAKTAARTSAAKTAGAKATTAESPAKKTRAKKADETAPAAAPGKAGDADSGEEIADEEVAALESEGAAFADGVDPDDQTPAMGDSVHTYLKSIGSTSLLTAEQEGDLAKRIQGG